MRGSPFFYFATLTLFKEYKRHIGILAISLILVFLLSSVLLVSSSIRNSIEISLQSQPDFVIQRIRGGKSIDLPMEWIDRLLEIRGISKVTPRVYGRYFFKDKREWALIVGVDFTEEQSHKGLEKLMGTLDLKSFLAKDSMLVGRAVDRYLEKGFYKDHYNFLTPEGRYKKVSIHGTLPISSSLISEQTIIMSQELAKEILGIDEDMVTDIALSVPNSDLWDSISDKLSSLYFDIRVVSKKDIQKAYENLYNYKGGFFLMLFLVLLTTFVLLLYQRYSTTYSSDRRHIGLMRALGWSIGDVLKLKLFESLAVAVMAYILGVSIAYFYVFVMGAPILKDIFIGGANLDTEILFVPVLDAGVLASIFILFVLPFIAAVLVPVWRIAITEPKEAML